MEQVSVVKDVRLEQAAQGDWASAAAWGDGDAIWDHLTRNTNMVKAVGCLDWSSLCPPGSRVLDLGCGSGWLAALLTREPSVELVLAWDSSPRLLNDALPRVFELAGGDLDKVEPVCGDFVPLLIDDASIDVVAMSSAFHHAQQPDRLLAELERVLSPGGTVALVNETPWPRLGMLGFATRMYAATVANLLGGSFGRAGHLGAEHVLYDDALGDRGYTLGAWRRMAARAGFSMTVVDSGLPSYPLHQRPRGRLEPNLTHLLLRRAS
jgi:ubiquinone/menaquinone biosynthesis C-methylase UbiE